MSGTDTAYGGPGESRSVGSTGMVLQNSDAVSGTDMAYEMRCRGLVQRMVLRNYDAVSGSDIAYDPTKFPYDVRF
eukprot:1420496-Rhodomonas_salina.1